MCAYLSASTPIAELIRTTAVQTSAAYHATLPYHSIAIQSGNNLWDLSQAAPQCHDVLRSFEAWMQ